MGSYQDPDHGIVRKRDVVIRTPKPGDKRAAAAKQVTLNVDKRWKRDVLAVVFEMMLLIFWIVIGLGSTAGIFAGCALLLAIRAVRRADVRGRYNNWRYGQMLANGRICVTHVPPDTVAAFDAAVEAHKLGEFGISSEDVMQDYVADVLDMQTTAGIAEYSTDEGNRKVATELLYARANSICHAIWEARELLKEDEKNEHALKIYREKAWLAQEQAVYADDPDE